MTTTKGYSSEREAVDTARANGATIEADRFGTYSFTPGGVRLRLVDAGAQGWLWLAQAAEVATYRERMGYDLAAGGGGIVCRACGATFTSNEGSVMRGHRRRCEVAPEAVAIPGSCDS